MHRHGNHPDERDNGPAHADAGDNAKDEVHQAQRSLGVVDRVDGLRRCARLQGWLWLCVCLSASAFRPVTIVLTSQYGNNISLIPVKLIKRIIVKRGNNAQDASVSPCASFERNRDWARGIERASLVSGGAFVAFGEKVKRPACVAMRRRSAQSHLAFGSHLRKSA